MKLLMEYLDAQQANIRGWRADYECVLLKDRCSVVWLARHYAGLLDDAIEVIGADRLRTLISANDEQVRLAQEKIDAARGER